MSIPFSRSMRSLQADSFRPSLLGIAVAITLFAAWAAWFFLARITFYETGQIVSVNRDGTIVADFNPGARGRIQSGQRALLRFDAANGELTRAIPAVVIGVNGHPQEERVRAELYILEDDVALASLQDGLTGQVEIAVERVSPATLVLQAAGLASDGDALSVGP